jgi:hypothetical protein
MQKLSLKNAKGMLSRKEMSTILGGYYSPPGNGRGPDECEILWNRVYFTYANQGLSPQTSAWIADNYERACRAGN